jgi:transposase-like protein
MADLKGIYRAVTLAAAERTLDELEARWGDKYPMVIKSWRDKWFTV